MKHHGMSRRGIYIRRAEIDRDRERYMHMRVTVKGPGCIRHN